MPRQPGAATATPPEPPLPDSWGDLRDIAVPTILRGRDGFPRPEQSRCARDGGWWTHGLRPVARRVEGTALEGDLGRRRHRGGSRRGGRCPRPHSAPRRAEARKRAAATRRSTPRRGARRGRRRRAARSSETTRRVARLFDFERCDLPVPARGPPAPSATADLPPA